jgi:hypothetical protein
VRSAEGVVPLIATPALAGGAMYLRGERHLFAVGEARARK